MDDLVFVEVDEFDGNSVFFPSAIDGQKCLGYVDGKLVDVGCFYNSIATFDSDFINRAYGSFVFVKLEGRVTHIFILGDISKIMSEFDLFEVPRSDESILHLSTNDLQNSTGDIFLLKKLIIRLRRFKRGNFDVTSQTYLPFESKSVFSDWSLFESLCVNALPAILKIFNSRYLLSIVDTYADFADAETRNVAIAISNYFFQERASKILLLIYKIVPRELAIADQQIPLWDGLLSTRLSMEDSYMIFLSRNMEMLDNSFVLRSIFLHLFRLSIDADSSIINFHKLNDSSFNLFINNFLKKY